MTYPIHSRDYLRRARRQLDLGTQEALFYAAYELRCGIEARLQQYLNAQDRVSEKKKKGWRVVQLSKDLEQVFNIGDKIANVKVRDRESGAVLHDFYFTPVSLNLRKMAGQLGDYLHSSATFHPDKDSWWIDTRHFIEQVYEELVKANIGKLLGPPLGKSGTNEVRFYTEGSASENVANILATVGETGTSVLLQIKYLDNIPESLRY